MKLKRTILILEDDDAYQEFYKEELQDDYNILQAWTLSEAEELMASEHIDFGLFDKILPDGDSVDMLARLSRLPFPVVVCSADNSLVATRKAMSIGVADFIEKPEYNLNRQRFMWKNKFRRRLDHQLRVTQVSFGSISYQRALASGEQAFFGSPLVGSSERIQQLRDDIDAIFDSQNVFPLMISGPEGTCKATIANHFIGRFDNRLKIVSFRAFGRTKVETEAHLFGSSFPPMEGILANIDYDGTAYVLEDFDLIDTTVQQRIIKMYDIKPFLLVLTVTHADEFDSRPWKARFQTISTVELKRRKEDIPALVSDYLLQKHNYSVLSPAVMKRIIDADWPGDLEQLYATLDLAFINMKMRRGSVLDTQDLQTYKHIPSNVDEVTTEVYEQYKIKCERDFFSSVLRLCNGNIKDMAIRLGFSRPTIYKKLGLA